jgi:DNA-binding phage protein
MSIREAIDKRRGKRSLSQYARDIGVARQTLYNAMDGTYQPSYKLLKALGLLRKEAAND